MSNASTIQTLLKQHIKPSRRDGSYFFKTGPGEYAEHDKFLGVTVPAVRLVAKQFVDASLNDVKALLSSPYNEERLLALFILVSQYRKADELIKKRLYQFYIDDIEQVNNWNLVDASAHHIIGAYLFEYGHNQEVLLELAQSNDLWKRRIAIIATWYCIKKFDFSWTLTIARMLLHDKHDLIHKAVGWMLREVGQKDINQLKSFLDEHAAIMPRTMLRYAIEKLQQDKRNMYLIKRREFDQIFM